jgi:prepilin-type N-terminal cleavage/methylation domain-containing protein
LLGHNHREKRQEVRRFYYCQKGFTIVEVSLATVIMLLVVAGTAAVYLMAMTTWHEGGAQVMLQRGASIAMEKMVRGVDGTDGIRESQSVACSSGSIQYTSGIDDKTRRFYLSNGEIWYEDPDETGDVSIAENVSGLTFTLSNDRVIITITMADQIRDKSITADLSTQVKLRNYK